MSAAFPCRTAGFLQLFFLVSILFLVPSSAAPVTDDLSQTEQGQISEYYGGESKKCYYNFQHYEEGDRIITNEPCLNCTCHKRMLMCYLRVCPFTKAIGQDCKVEKKPDQCCPVITCPEVPVQLLTSSTTEQPTTSRSTAVAHPDNHGCRLQNNSFYPDGAQLPIASNKPCELCYCIRNRTACVMQECTLNVEGCRPVYQDGVCCPVRYDCDYYDVSTTERPSTGGLQLTPTPKPLGCRYGNTIYNDGEKIKTDKPCESCYCMRGDIVCAVRSCGTPLEGKDCEPLPTPPGECCPTSYKCANGTVPIESLSQETATASTYTLHIDNVPTDHPEQQQQQQQQQHADNVEHDFPEHDEQEEEEEEEEAPEKTHDDDKEPAPSEIETEGPTNVPSDSEKPIDQTPETAQHQEQVHQVSQNEEVTQIPPSDNEKPIEETVEGHIEQVHGDESTGQPEAEDSNLSTSGPAISVPSDSAPGLVSKPQESDSAHIDDTLIPTAIPDEYSGIEESIKNNTIQSLITDLLHPEDKKPIDVNDLVTSSPDTAESETNVNVQSAGDKEDETSNKPVASEESEGTPATTQEEIYHSPEGASSSVPIESASSVLKPEDETVVKETEPAKSDTETEATTDQDEHSQKPISVESDSIPEQSGESATESEQTAHEHPVHPESDDSLIIPDVAAPGETPVAPDQVTHIESDEGQTKPEEPVHVDSTAHPEVPEAETVKPEEPSVETSATPAEEPSIETQTVRADTDETKIEEHLGESSVAPEQPAVTELAETEGKPEESLVETSVVPEHEESTEHAVVANKPEQPSTVDHLPVPEQPATEESEDLATPDYSSVTSSVEDDQQVPVESDQTAAKPEELSTDIPELSVQHESEGTAQPETQDASGKPGTVESETVETKPEEHVTAEPVPAAEEPTATESSQSEQIPEKPTHDETEHSPSLDSNKGAKPDVVPFVGVPGIPDLPVVSDEVEHDAEEHIEPTVLPEQSSEPEAESTAAPHEHSVPAASDNVSGEPEETATATEVPANVEGTAKPEKSPEETPNLAVTEQPAIADSDESAQKPEEHHVVSSETLDAIPQQPSVVGSDDVEATPDESSLKPNEDTATESTDISETSEVNKPHETEESSKPESKPDENIIASDNEAPDVSTDLHPTESSQGEGVTESDHSIQTSKPEEEINQISVDSVKPEDNKVEDATVHETTVLHEHEQSPVISDDSESEQEQVADTTGKPEAEEVTPGKLDNTVEEVPHPSSGVQHEIPVTDSENSVATELSEGEKPVETKPEDEGNAVEDTTEVKPEAPESNVIHDNEQNIISETNTAISVEHDSEESHVDTNEQPSESEGETTAKTDISESSDDSDVSHKPDVTKESSESSSSEESGAHAESDTATVESVTLHAAIDESPAPATESQEMPTIPEDAQEPEKNESEGEDTNQIPEQSFDDSQSTSQEDITTDKDQTNVAHVSEDTDKPSKTDIPTLAESEEPATPSEADQGELQTHVESNTAEVPTEEEEKEPDKHESETAAPEADESSKPEESTSVNIFPEEVKPVETSQNEPVDSENQVNGEKPVAPEILPPSSESVNEDASTPNEIPDIVVPVHGGAVQIESIGQHLPGPTGILSSESELGVIPGEGSCLVDDVTYSNNSKIPSSSQCHKECVCISSIVHCIGIDCPPPPPHLSNCMPIQQGPDSCCLMYACDGETPTLLESHSQIGGSDSSKQPTEGSDTVQQPETPESPEQPLDVQTAEPAHDESSVTIHGAVVPDHVESDSASSQSVHEPETSEVVPEKPAHVPEHPSLPSVPENVEHDFIPEQPSEQEKTDIPEDQALTDQEHTESHQSAADHETPDTTIEQQTSVPENEPSDVTKESDKVSDTSLPTEHITESSVTHEDVPENPEIDTSLDHSAPSVESATAVTAEESESTEQPAIESKPSEVSEDLPAPTESVITDVPSSHEEPIHDTSSGQEDSKPIQEGSDSGSSVQPQETQSNVSPAQDTVEIPESSESSEQPAVTDSVVHESVSEDVSISVPSQEGQQVPVESGETQKGQHQKPTESVQTLLHDGKPSSVKFESAETELSRPEESNEQDASTSNEAVESVQQSTEESGQISESHKDEVPQEVTEDVQQSTATDSSKVSEDTTPSVHKDELSENSEDSHVPVTDINKIGTSGETVNEDTSEAQTPEDSSISVTETPVNLDVPKPEEISPGIVDQEPVTASSHSEQPSISHDDSTQHVDHAHSVSEEVTASEEEPLVTSGPLDDAHHLVTSSPFKPEASPNADKHEQDAASDETGKPSVQHTETEEGTPSTVESQHTEEPIYQEVPTETGVHVEGEGEAPAALPESTEGPSKLPEQDDVLHQQQTQDELHQPLPEKPSPVESDIPEETTVQVGEHEPETPSKADIPIESHVQEEIPKPNEAQEPQEETAQTEETEKPTDQTATPTQPEQPQVIISDGHDSTVEHKPEEPVVTNVIEEVPEKPHITTEEQEPPKSDVELKPEEPQTISGELEPPKADVEPSPEEPHITSSEHEPPKADVESKPEEEPQITSSEHEPPKADVESKPEEEPQITSSEHVPPKADIESKPEEPQITSSENEPPKADVESKPEEEPQITSSEHEPPKADTETQPEEPQITTSEHEPPKADTEPQPEEPQINIHEQTPPKPEETELKPEEPHITSDEVSPTKVDIESKPEEAQITSDEQTPPKVESELKPEEPEITSDEQKPLVTDHEPHPEAPQITSDSVEPSGGKPEEPQITSDTSLDQKPEEPHITTNIETQPEVNIEQKPDNLVPFTDITQDKVQSQHVTVAPDSVNELHSEHHQTLTKPIDHIPVLYPEEDSNYGPLQVPGWTPKPYQPSEPTDEINQQEEHFSSGGDMDYELEEDGPFGPGTCRYSGKIYVSAQQIPRDDPCDFCFCFRSDIICLQQSCPPPIHRCRQESIKGFCCPRYECPVSMATALNLTTTTTTTTTTLPPHFFAHAYKGAARRTGCQVRGKAYRVGEEIRSASGPCLQCICGADGQMKCDPKVCSPEPMLRKMMEEAISRRRR